MPRIASSTGAPVVSDLHAAFEVAKGTFTLRVDLTFHPGVTAILGPSGAGKSTLVAALVGALRPTAGALRLGNVPWFEAAKGVFVPPEGRGIGVVLQSLALFPHMTALENASFGLVRGKEAHARAWLEKLGVGHLADRRPRTYSGGEAQRVAIARALAIDRDVLVLDEPFAALDDTTRSLVLDALRGVLEARERLVVLVTHHTPDVDALSARKVHVVDGRVAATR